MLCPSCGNVIIEENPVFCPHCGVNFATFSDNASAPLTINDVKASEPVQTEAVTESVESRKRVDTSWYLLPILLGIIGGLIGYLVVKDRDERTAGRLLAVGIASTVIYAGVTLYSYQVLLQRFGLAQPSPSVDIRESATFNPGSLTVYLANYGNAQAEIHYIAVYRCASSTNCSPGNLFYHYAWPCAPGDVSVACVTQKNSGTYYDKLAFTAYPNGTKVDGDTAGYTAYLSPGGSASFTIPFVWAPNTPYFIILTSQPIYQASASLPGWIETSPSS